MKKTIQFRTKTESNEEEEKAFLALTPSQRFLHFLKLCEELAPFTKPKTDFGNNLVLERKATNGLRK